MQGKKDYKEKMFTSFQLSSRVPEDNMYRRLKEVLDLQWLYRTTKKFYGSEGQQSIDPTVFFKLILIGYLENLQSDRKIISTVSMRLDMLILSVMTLMKSCHGIVHLAEQGNCIMKKFLKNYLNRY